MMKALNGLDMEISLCNRMSLLSVLHHKDRSVPSSCQITSLQVSLFFVIFPYFSLSFNCYEICSVARVILNHNVQKRVYIEISNFADNSIFLGFCSVLYLVLRSK